MKTIFFYLIIFLFFTSCIDNEVIKSSGIQSVELKRLSDDQICQFSSQTKITSLINQLNDCKISDVIKLAPRYRIVINYTADKETLVLGSKNSYRKRRGNFESNSNIHLLIEKLMNSCE